MSAGGRQSHPETIPASLVTYENLQNLMQLLTEKESLRRNLKSGNLGQRLKSVEEANALLDRVAKITHEVLRREDNLPKEPQLVLTDRLKKLPAMTFRIYLFYIPLCALLLYLVLSAPKGGVALLVVLAALVLLLAVPYLVYRRTRLNIEHSGKYRRKAEGRAVIEIDQLQSVQFQSCLAHEYAHHLYYELGGQIEEAWPREGWARLVQWHVMDNLCRTEENPAYLYHVLLQIIGELKFACIVLSSLLRVRLPSKVRRIRTIYSNNPFYRLIAGTPGFSMNSLTRHAVGTASCLLIERRYGLHQALRECLRKPFTENS